MWGNWRSCPAGSLASKLIFTLVDVTFVDGLEVWISRERACNEQHFGAVGCWVQGNKAEALPKLSMSCWRKKKRRNSGRLAEESTSSPQGKEVCLILRGASLRDRRVLEIVVVELSRNQTFCILIYLCPLSGVKALNWVLKQVFHSSRFFHFELKSPVVRNTLKCVESDYY